MHNSTSRRNDTGTIGSLGVHLMLWRSALLAVEVVAMPEHEGSTPFTNYIGEDRVASLRTNRPKTVVHGTTSTSTTKSRHRVSARHRERENSTDNDSPGENVGSPRTTQSRSMMVQEFGT